MLGVAGAATAACGRASGPRAALRALVVRAPKDTIRFEAQASAHPCVEGAAGGFVLQGLNGGNGMLVWLRTRDSIPAGDWSVVARGDTVTPRGASVAVRFMLGGMSHGTALDSGAVSLHRDGARVSARVRGSGLETVGAVRVTLDASFGAVPLAAEGVSCQASQ